MTEFNFLGTRFHDTASPSKRQNVVVGKIESQDINETLRLIGEGKVTDFPLYAAHVSGEISEGRVVEGWYLSAKAIHDHLVFPLQQVLLKMGLPYDTPNSQKMAESLESWTGLVVQGEEGKLERILTVK